MKNGGGRWEVTGIGCPDCAGVVKVRMEGRHGHREYRCHVGHRFSTRSLLRAKEMQVEFLLWSAVAAMNHLELLCGRLDEEVPGPRRAGPLRRRLREVRRQQQTIRAMIDGTAVCDLGGL